MLCGSNKSKRLTRAPPHSTCLRLPPISIRPATALSCLIVLNEVFQVKQASSGTRHAEPALFSPTSAGANWRGRIAAELQSEAAAGSDRSMAAAHQRAASKSPTKPRIKSPTRLQLEATLLNLRAKAAGKEKELEALQAENQQLESSLM